MRVSLAPHFVQLTMNTDALSAFVSPSWARKQLFETSTSIYDMSTRDHSEWSCENQDLPKGSMFPDEMFPNVSGFQTDPRHARRAMSDYMRLRYRVGTYLSSVE